MTNKEDAKTPEPTQLEANKVSIKIPPFWVDKPEMWFYTIEAQFKIAGITCEETRFTYLLAQMEPKFVENIWDIMKEEKSTKKYTDAKDRLLNTFKESNTRRIQRLLTGLELGDSKPSQLLRKMKSLGGDVDVSETVLRTLWMEKMPDRIKNVLIVSEEDTEKLAVMADKIAEMYPRYELAPVQQAPAAAPYDALLARLASLENQIASLSVNHISRPRTRDATPSSRRRSQSGSKRRYDPQGKYCWYHYRFGSKCHSDKCTQPCSWVSGSNSNSENASLH